MIYYNFAADKYLFYFEPDLKEMRKKVVKPFFARSIPKILDYFAKEWGLTSSSQAYSVKIAWDAAALLDKTISVGKQFCFFLN